LLSALSEHHSLSLDKISNPLLFDMYSIFMNTDRDALYLLHRYICTQENDRSLHI
jgi:hypothetical protein